jgi:hypothetical protein
MRHRQGAENYLAEDILKYLSGPVRKYGDVSRGCFSPDIE